MIKRLGLLFGLLLFAGTAPAQSTHSPNNLMGRGIARIERAAARIHTKLSRSASGARAEGCRDMMGGAAPNAQWRRLTAPANSTKAAK